MFKFISKLLTKNTTEIPLVFINFNLKLYNSGETKNCIAHLHPVIKNDEEVINKTKELIDLIRSKYDMENML